MYYGKEDVQTGSVNHPASYLKSAGNSFRGGKTAGI
jgi:hypothetical protein